MGGYVNEAKLTATLRDSTQKAEIPNKDIVDKKVPLFLRVHSFAVLIQDTS